MKNELDQLRRKVAALEKQCAQLETIHRASRDQLLKIFHASSNLMAITTIKEGRIIDMNEASAGLGGFKREELIGTLSSEHSLWANQKQRDEVMRRLQAEGRLHHLPVEFRGKAGELHKVLFSADPIAVNGEDCLLSVSIDITAREKEADVLKQSEEKYRALVENSLQGLAIIQDGRFVFCNSAFSQITGYSIDELLSLPPKRMGNLTHPEDRDIVFNRYRDRLAGLPVASRYEVRGVKKDGTQIWLEVYASLMEYNGRPATQLVYMDITERKQAEIALRESEERFRLIAETIDEVFWIYDPENAVTTYVSPAHDRIFGYPRKQLYESREPSLEPVHPEDRAQVAASFALVRDGQPINFEYRIIRQDGSIRHIWNRGFPVPNESGKIKRYIGVVQDVTEWRRAEEALKESREYLNQIINSIGDPIFVRDREHSFLLVNEAFCNFFGISREEFLGRTRLESLNKNLQASIWETEEAVFNSGIENVSEDDIIDWQGNERVVMAKKSLLTDKNGNRQLIGVLRDITDHKRLEAQFLQAQKMEAIGILAGGVAHDFNNLLNVINGYSELILDEISTNNPIRKDLEQIRDAGRRAATLTSQLLAFGRKQILQPEILDLNKVIMRMGTMLRRLIGEDIELVSITDPNLEPVNADPGKIEQIVMNLAVNARDAMPQGGKLTIETANVDFDGNYVREHPPTQKGSYVMLAISDNGIGMDTATQAHLFEPFFTTKEKGKGTGLGLSTVYGIVKQSDGFIWTYSEPGNGTTFKIYFPRAQGAIARDAVEVKIEAGFQGSETVLVVEDEASVRSLAGRILRDRGYNVLEASDGMEALRLAEGFAEKIHMILTDAIMPGMSGKELVSRIEASRPGIKSLFVSGYTDNSIVHHGILDSNIAFLQKPFTVDSLSRKVRQVLNS